MVISRALAATMLLTATVALAGKSTTTIPIGQAFVLGGDQTKPLTVSGKNVGLVAVRIVARHGSAKKLLATVAPGGNIGGTFAVGDAAVIENTSSTKSAVISVEFNASVNSLTMDYKPVGK